MNARSQTTAGAVIQRSLLSLLLVGCGSGQPSGPDGSARSAAGNDAGHRDAGDSASAIPGPPSLTCSTDACEGFCRTLGRLEASCAGTACLCAAASGCEPGELSPCFTGDPSLGGVGACQAGSATCEGTGGEFGEWGVCRGSQLPEDESCNGLDDDCDGRADEGLPCLPEGDPCTEDEQCDADLRCVEFPSGRELCGNPLPCFGVDGSGECGRDKVCTEFPDGSSYCYDEPQTACWSHAWFASVDAEGVGHHFDTCMSCTDRPGLERGSTCTGTVDGPDLVLACEGSASGRTEVRRNPAPTYYEHDLLALDMPMHNPAEMGRCLVGWGVHPLTRVSQAVPPRSPGGLDSRARIAGGASGHAPLERDGFRTLLPASAFQHVYVEDPPLPTVPVPTTKEERAARVFWEEPSMAGRRTAPLESPYAHCAECDTYEELIDHMYPGPEIFCQGLPRDPADSQFVIPFWMPYYDARYGRRDLMIVTEQICEMPGGAQIHSVTAWPLPYTWPESFPATFP